MCALMPLFGERACTMRHAAARVMRGQVASKPRLWPAIPVQAGADERLWQFLECMSV